MLLSPGNKDASQNAKSAVNTTSDENAPETLNWVSDHLGAALHVLRGAKNVSQARLAKMITDLGEPIDQATISRAENNEGRGLTPRQLERACQAMGYRLADLFRCAHELAEEPDADEEIRQLSDVINEATSTLTDSLDERERVAFDTLRARIYQGAICPGETISAAQVQAEFFLRNGRAEVLFAILESQFMVRVVGTSECVVCQFSIDEMIEICRERHLMETIAQIELARRANLDLSSLQRIHDRMNEYDTTEGIELVRFVDDDVDFHRCLFEEALKSDQIPKLTELTRKVIVGTRSISFAERSREVLEEHTAILIAIRNADPVAIVQAVRNHVLNTVRRCSEDLTKRLKRELSAGIVGSEIVQRRRELKIRQLANECCPAG